MAVVGDVSIAQLLVERGGREGGRGGGGGGGERERERSRRTGG